MKKKILILDESEVLLALKKGKSVEGRLKMEKTEDGTFCLCFKAWKRTVPKGRRERGRIIFRTEHGWVKESKERIKTYESVPKELGVKRIAQILERDMYEVSDFLLEEAEGLRSEVESLRSKV